MKKLSIALALLLVVGCGELPTDSPELTAEVTFSVVSGAAQTGLAHMELPEPLVVRAELEGHPWKGQVVNFVVTGGGGSVFAGAALTDNKGLAQDYWTLGGPGPQVVQVRAVDSNTGAKLGFATFTAMAFEPVAITSASLTYGVIGTAYSQTVTATGGDGSYAWAITAGLLPAGLSQDAVTGAISGTPTAAGTSSFTVQVTSGSQTATKELSLTVTSGGAGLGIGFGPEQFSWIPAGTFLMGNPTDQGNSQEVWVRTVTITKPFYMQKTEVTQGQWKAVMGESPRWGFCLDACPAENPVGYVSWNDVQGFLTKLNAMDPDKNYRLPTEAEWEYAARAGTTGDYGGNGVIDDMGWHSGNSGPTPHPVAGKLPNAWELYDMHGNVFEWVQDWMGEYPPGPATDPTGPTGPPTPDAGRVARGGSWDLGADFARSYFRYQGCPTCLDDRYGFRLAWTP